MTELTQLWIRVRLVLKVSFEPANLLAKNVTAYTDANGHVAAYTYDSNGNVLTTTDANGAIIRVAYNSPEFTRP